MVFGEVDMVELREVLRASWPGWGWVWSRRGRGVDRKTARRYVQAAHDAGLTRDCGRRR